MWVARCYEIAFKIVASGLVDGEAVYGHWIGKVARGSHFADRARIGFVNHGWISLADGRVMDPTRWVFEGVAPYIYVGEPPDHWNITPCENCQLLKEEHGDHGPADQCDMFEPETWPYDEGGDHWRTLMTRNKPPPVPEGPRQTLKLEGLVAIWVGALLNERSGTSLAMNQLFYVANLPYGTMLKAVGREGIKAIYEAICNVAPYASAWIPADNANRARRECGFKIC